MTSGEETADLMPFQDPNQSVDDRVQDLLTRPTLEEKCSQLLSDSPAIGRLGVPAYH